MNRAMGIFLVMLAIAGLAWGGFTYTTKEKIIDLGPIEATREKTHSVSLPPIFGGLARVGGILRRASPNRIPWRLCPENRWFLLGSRYCETDLIMFTTSSGSATSRPALRAAPPKLFTIESGWRHPSWRDTSLGPSAREGALSI